MKSFIVLGAGFGDEGKGRTVSYLCSQIQNENDVITKGDGGVSIFENPVLNKACVVRFNGGHQAGHTVVYNKIRHVFSSFGAGTLQGIPTYWSKYCTVYPIAFMNEYLALDKLGIKPIIYIDAQAPVTTPYDVYANRTCDKYKKDGTCGVGFGKTIERHQHIKLFFSDLFNETILRAKLKNIEQYYNVPPIYAVNMSDKQVVENFIDKCKQLIEITGTKSYTVNELSNFNNLIFEGAQGILLDKDFGFSPNTTWSNCTSQNAIEILKEINELDNDIYIYYVTRCYQTRHGNGYMSDERELSLTNNKNETNVFNEYQRNFRTGRFDINLFNYAVQCDNIIHKRNKLYSNINKNLVITCLDQLEDGKREYDFSEKFLYKYFSTGPETEKMFEV